MIRTCRLLDFSCSSKWWNFRVYSILENLKIEVVNDVQVFHVTHCHGFILVILLV